MTMNLNRAFKFPLQKLPARLGAFSLIGLLMATAGCGRGGDGSDADAIDAELQKTVTANEVYEGVVKPPDSPPTITRSQYDQSAEGLSYNEVVDIVGVEADILHDDSYGPTGAARRIAQWFNADASYAKLTFINTRLLLREEKGLQ